jgi:hypothetical protein
MQLQPSRGVYEQGEAHRVALSETEGSKGLDLLVDGVGNFAGDPVVAHPVIEPSTHPLDAIAGPLGAHGPAQLVGLSRSEVSGSDRNLH